MEEDKEQKLLDFFEEAIKSKLPALLERVQNNWSAIFRAANPPELENRVLPLLVSFLASTPSYHSVQEHRPSVQNPSLNKFFLFFASVLDSSFFAQLVSTESKNLYCVAIATLINCDFIEVRKAAIDSFVSVLVLLHKEELMSSLKLVFSKLTLTLTAKQHTETLIYCAVFRNAQFSGERASLLAHLLLLAQQSSVARFEVFARLATLAEAVGADPEESRTLDLLLDLAEKEPDPTLQPHYLRALAVVLRSPARAKAEERVCTVLEQFATHKDWRFRYHFVGNAPALVAELVDHNQELTLALLNALFLLATEDEELTVVFECVQCFAALVQSLGERFFEFELVADAVVAPVSRRLLETLLDFPRTVLAKPLPLKHAAFVVSRIAAARSDEPTHRALLFSLLQKVLAYQEPVAVTGVFGVLQEFAENQPVFFHLLLSDSESFSALTVFVHHGQAAQEWRVRRAFLAFAAKAVVAAPDFSVFLSVVGPSAIALMADSAFENRQVAAAFAAAVWFECNAATESVYPVDSTKTLAAAVQTQLNVLETSESYLLRMAQAFFCKELLLFVRQAVADNRNMRSDWKGFVLDLIVNCLNDSTPNVQYVMLEGLCQAASSEIGELLKEIGTAIENTPNKFKEDFVQEQVVLLKKKLLVV